MLGPLCGPSRHKAAPTKGLHTPVNVGAALCREMRAKPSPAVSQPHTIPMRILARSPDQASPNGIGDDVAGNRPDILLTSQSPVMKAGLPDMSPVSAHLVQSTTASGLEPTHQRPQVRRAKLDKPVKMIRHQDPGQRSTSLALFTEPQLLDHGPGESKIIEQRRSVTSGCGEQIKAPGFRHSTAT